MNTLLQLKDYMDILGLLIGLAIFLFGMSLLGEGLEKQAGGSLSKVLGKLTSNPFKGLGLGAGVTAVIQSSSATSVMVVGFVNSGILTFKQSIAIIMGANIGTTITSWILSLTGIEGGAWYVQMLKPANFTPILAIIGIFLYMGKNQKRKDIGFLLLSFSILMKGMDIMSAAVAGLKEFEAFQNLFTLFQNPILGVLVGAIVTAVIQSSSASIGILQALSGTGKINFGAAIPIILGQNIGTCVTAMLSSVGANKAAKRVSVLHLIFNVLGTILFMAAFYGINAVREWPFMDGVVDKTSIAIVHTVFNVVVTLVLFPMSSLLEKLAYKLVPDAKEKETTELLDERFLQTPSVAVDRCRVASLDMANIVKNSLEQALSLFDKYDEKVAEKVLQYEDESDKYEDKIATYLLRLSGSPLTAHDSGQVSLILHAIGDWERIGDHCVNLLDSAKELKDKGVNFSDDAKKDIAVIKAALIESMDLTVKAFEDSDYDAVGNIEALEEVIDRLRYKLKERHVTRLKEGNCSVETGFIFSDMLTSIERISDHCANVAVAMYELNENTFDRHEFWSTTNVKKDFENEFKQYSMKYSLK